MAGSNGCVAGEIFKAVDGSRLEKLAAREGVTAPLVKGLGSITLYEVVIGPNKVRNGPFLSELFAEKDTKTFLRGHGWVPNRVESEGQLKPHINSLVDYAVIPAIYKVLLR